MSKPIPVVIDRSRWLRGEGSSRSRLLRPSDNKMCCLGFCSLALGIGEGELEDLYTPYGLDGEAWKRWHAHLGEGEYTDRYQLAISKAMRVNDDREPDEARLTKLLAPWFTLEFVDGPVEP